MKLIFVTVTDVMLITLTLRVIMCHSMSVTESYASLIQLIRLEMAASCLPLTTELSWFQRLYLCTK